MFVMTVAAGDTGNAAEWAGAWAAIVAAGVAFVSMVGSGIGWWRSRKQAGKAEKAFQDIAGAQQAQVKTDAERRADEEKRQARLITVESGLFGGRPGLVVRNGDTGSVFELQLGIVGEAQVFEISASGNAAKGPWAKIGVLSGGTTTTRRVYQRMGGG